MRTDTPEQEKLEKLTKPLQDWFRLHARRLPWRDQPTPYYVWVSEIMLQQTRVEAVRMYFARFVAALPDVAALADCPEDRYLKLWEGLGYYNRVRNLHTAAQQVMTDYGGVIPDTPEELKKLKGIGSYTAGAIASIAYNRPVPAVDGNVLRVMMRVFADDSDIAKPAVRTALERRLQELMQRQNGSVLMPRIYNQALMELGALVCVPNGEPHCADCPWERFCEAHRQGLTDMLPVKSKAAARRIEARTVFVISDGGRAALRKRPDKGLLAGLYELPNETGHLTPDEALSYARALGLAPLHIRPLPPAKHIFSHVEWHMLGYLLLVENPEPHKNDLLFAEVREIAKRYAIPSAFSAYVAYLKEI